MLSRAAARPPGGAAAGLDPPGAPRPRSRCTRAAACRSSSPGRRRSLGMTDLVLVVVLLAAAAGARLAARRPADGPVRRRPSRGAPRCRSSSRRATRRPRCPRCWSPCAALTVARRRGRRGRRRLPGRDGRGRPRRRRRPSCPRRPPAARLDRQGLGLPRRRRRHQWRPAALPRRRHRARARTRSTACSSCTTGTVGWCRCSPSTRSCAPTSSSRPTSTWCRCWPAAPSPVAPRRRPMAFGPCLLTSRADYERAGGHAAVRGEILDDVAAGGGLRPGRAAGALRRRRRSRSGCAAIPAGSRQLADGWTKNIASGASAAAPGPTLAAVLWISAHHAVAVGAAPRAGRGRDRVGRVPDGRATRACGRSPGWRSRRSCGRILRRIGSFRWWTWALFPVPPARLRRRLRAVGRAHGRYGARCAGAVATVDLRAGVLRLGGARRRPDARAGHAADG